MFISCLLGGWWTGALPAACPARFALHLNAVYSAWHLPAAQGMFPTGELTEVSRWSLVYGREAMPHLARCSTFSISAQSILTLGPQFLGKVTEGD